ncbi:flavin-containing monooxygenase FMO GS-OX5-like isoform X2 [Cornus florida]|uniref:flavin-containing monooxygenase FMO GS-OX5-like isoform X2 n=1 Tax=Cornus florida TaxID=4283 RepID=UPI00289DD934|nr:flavin-containing monooxygenase FMO GS-OX5-like isoform X2 [Cornus florida]
MARSLKVAVIGAGAAGLIAARELQSEGHRVVVYEKGDRLGGTWVYDSRVESDPLGLDPNREIVHSSAYQSLRTNLPRHVMGFSDYPFTVGKNGDSRNFPGHEEVLRFLNDFARDFGLTELIRFDSEVVKVEQLDLRNDEWIVESRTSGLSSADTFEAVVVCNGHFTEPRLANLPGIEKWSGNQVHSHNYRVPEPFRNQIVVMVGAGPSAIDISRDIAKVAKEVHLSSRSPSVKVSKLDNCDNIWQHSKIDYVYEDSTITFEEGYSVKADVIFHCTGYKYHVPFLKTNGTVTIDDNRIGPLYKHVFPPQLGPWLSFVGIPFKFEYMDWLAAQVGIPPLEEKRKRLYVQIWKLATSSQPEGYRDEWDIDNWISQTI